MVAFAGLDRQVRALARPDATARPERRSAAQRDSTSAVPAPSVANLTPLLELSAPVLSLAVSPRGSYVAVGTWRPGAEIRELFGGGRRSWVARDTVVRAIAFSADEKLVATGGDDGSARVWDLTADAETDQELSRLSHRDAVTAVAFSRDGEYLVTASDRLVRVLHWRTDDLMRDACGRLRRNLSVDEWAQHLPSEARRATCEGLPMTDEDMSLAERLQRRLDAGRPSEALALLRVAENSGVKVSPSRWNATCRTGSLWGYSGEMQPACDRAVELKESDPGARDSRGLARALAGDPRRAIEDLRYFLAKGNPTAAVKERRARWIARLEQGLEPFDPDETHELLSE
jgi:hypothetical protein